MNKYVYSLEMIDKNTFSKVGGKGANLGELLKIEGINVPKGFVITTEAYVKAIERDKEVKELLEELNNLDLNDLEKISSLSKKTRFLIENLEIEDEIKNEIDKELSKYDENQSYAVRSSATAEDLPYASFAGQQDSFLNVRGRDNIENHILKCWASLFTERAVTYRIQNGFDHKKVHISVIVQKMILSEKSGIMFTANPMTSDRKIISIDAGYGLGEALVSGLINPDNYKVINGKISEKSIGNKDKRIEGKEVGGTKVVEIEKTLGSQQVLEDSLILELANIGKKIEKHFNFPQDIEWCYKDKEFFIVQSRPITTLFPLGETLGLETPRVYMSIGHIQMMTDSIKPLGMSFFEMISEVKLEKIGGRFFTDITHDLSSTVGRNRLLMGSGKQDPLIQNALKTLIEDGDFIKNLPKGKRNLQGGIFTFGSISEAFKTYFKNDPEEIKDLYKNFQIEIDGIEDEISKLSGVEVIDYIKKDSKKLLEMAYHPVMLGAIIASIMVNESLDKQIEKLIGEKNVGDALTKSLDNNVTTNMGLMLGDLSDVVRKHPQVLDFLSNNPKDDTFFIEMEKLSGGKEVTEAFEEFLEKFGMRCPGEIDITKERFEEKPTQLIPIILSNIGILSFGEHRRDFQKRKFEAEEKKREIIESVRESHGARKAKKIQKMIELLRNFLGAREDPKYFIVQRFYIYKKAIIREAKRLVDIGILRNVEDAYYLYLEEFRDVIEKNQVDYSTIDLRREAYKHFKTLTPPRVFTSDGYVPNFAMEFQDLPNEALVGIPVSSGVIEGRARIVLKVEDANLEKGDILVTQFTDPSWTPLFVTIKGLVTEVGGFTTHSAIVTREYGLPGVVGVENATNLIKDGQKIRVNGTKGYVEIIE